MNIILNGGLLLLVGFLAGKLANVLKFPAVTGYLIGGILIGPSVFNFLSHDMLRASIWISHGALALIAFSIGSQFTIGNIRRLGARVIWIATLEALGGLFAVMLAMIFVFRQPVPVALLYGAIAAATAPAATLMVIRELRASGPMTDTLLAVVAIDDPICVIAFGIASGLSAMLMKGTALSLGNMILGPLWEITRALGLGLMIGLGVSLAVKWIQREADVQVLVLGAIFVSTGLALILGLSPLLTCMALGSAVGNASRRGDKVFEAITALDTPVYVAFFTLSGAGLHVELLRRVGLLGIGYVAFRVLGKILGASLGATVTRAPGVVRRYLGLGLVPQAGVALGLSLLVKQQFPGIGDVISTTIVASTVIYELIGPVCSKIGISLAGEAGGCVAGSESASSSV
ncbi:MAG TPA: cation:proton antiporter [Firmicutes bacterium]|nr:cation:proton antiporter [Bacillota bacterium]